MYIYEKKKVHYFFFKLIFFSLVGELLALFVGVVLLDTIVPVISVYFGGEESAGKLIVSAG